MFQWVSYFIKWAFYFLNDILIVESCDILFETKKYLFHFFMKYVTSLWVMREGKGRERGKVVTDSWLTQTVDHCTKMCIFNQKLKFIKLRLKEWNIQVFRNLFKERISLKVEWLRPKRPLKWFFLHPNRRREESHNSIGWCLYF